MASNLQSIKQRYGIIGRSETLDRALDTALRVAPTDLSVLISGESGVGKEVFSRIIHDNSPRKHGGFIAINCGAIPEGTINSELFGHERGAFTSAAGERKGYFESYDGGTIFLDEIGEMPLQTQTFLLRVLESGEFVRMGSNKVQKTDVRIVAATNVNLMEAVRKGKFREDLYFRLNTVPINLPPLRERQEDIYMLFRKFAVDFAERYRTQPIQLDEAARRIVEHYAWPGNIRELRNVVDQLSILAEDKLVNASFLTQTIPGIQQRNLPGVSNGGAQSEQFAEREILYKVLFDMKSDLNDLKSLVFELIRKNNLQVPNNPQLSSLGLLKAGSNSPAPDYAPMPASAASGYSAEQDYAFHDLNEVEEDARQPIILGKHYDESEVVEESLSLEDNERELIVKALKKHQGHRREAALDLGISERTLYRKIEKYNLL